MAAITPQADGALPLGIMGSRLHHTRTGLLTTGGTQGLLADGVTVPRKGLHECEFFFSGVGDGDTWTGAPRGTVDVWWKGEDVDDDFVIPYIIQRGGIGVQTVIEFQTTGAAKTGWVLVRYR